MVHPDWISRLQQSFQDPKVMAVTGLVLAAELETEAQFIFEKYWGFNRGYRVLTFEPEYFEKLKPWGFPAWRIGAGANMAFRRQVFKLVGDFDERLDVGAAGCSGDSEFWYRVLAEGAVCRYEPTAVVYHYHRRDMDSLKRQIYFYMRGHVAALLIQFEKYRHWGNLRRLFFALPKHYTKLFLRGLRKGFKYRYSTVFAEVSGCLSGLIFYLQNRQGKDINSSISRKNLNNNY
jgi:GT2 family glycosyltransferase